MIPFNKPYLTGKEAHYLYQAVYSGKISGNGYFTQLCHKYFEDRYHFRKCLLATSCTDALEMAAILIGTEPGDEIIMPSYTFVSTANAFVLRGAKIVFADSLPDHPNLDISKIEALITPKTKAVVAVHYAGTACDMDALMSLAAKHNFFVIEDAAQAIDSFYKGRPLGSIGHLGAFSFHETKNIISGEGGMLTINDERFEKRAEIIWEKGTNRAAFGRKEVNKYGWVDIGSSFLPSEIISAFLYAQLENLDMIQEKRKSIWQNYHVQLSRLQDMGLIQLPVFPEYATNNAHIFYILCKDYQQREELISAFRENDILSVFHYLSLHKSPFYEKKHDGRELPHADSFTNRLLRLPLFFELEDKDVKKITNTIYGYFGLPY
jgi:dTDP-4-amino-4,6-dideoxygalactose transaminase